MNRIRVALFDNRTEAEVARDELARAGVDAAVRAESGMARLWLVSRWRAGVRVEAAADSAARARELLRHAAASQSWAQKAIRCPECRSFRVDFPQFTEKSLLTNLTMGLAAELGLIERQYYCEECHCMWAKAGSGPTCTRLHLAPNYFLESVEPATDARPMRHLSREQGRPPGLPVRAGRGREQCALWDRNHPRFKLQILGLTVAVAGIVSPDTHAQLRAYRPENGQLAVRLNRAAATPKSPTYLRDVLPILMGKCARCHSDQTVLPNLLDYETAARKRWEIKRRVWDSWQGTYFKQPMPVANGPEAAAMTDEERQVIRDWVENGVPRGVAPVYSDRLSRTEKMEMGKRLFTTICAACHQPTGSGIPGRFPPLARSDFLNADKHRAIKVIVNGLQGEVVVNGQPFNNAMPQFPLTDQDIASALTFVYNSFGNSGKEVTPDEVRAVRSEKAEPATAAISTAKVPEEKSPYE